MANKDYSELVITPAATIVFPNLFEAKAVIDPKTGQAQGEPKFSMVMLFTPDDTKEMRKIAAKLAQTKWPNRDLKTLNAPLKKGDTEADKQADKGRDGEFYRGYTVVNAKSKYEPEIIGPDKKYIIDPKEVYSGMIARAQLNLKTYSSGSNEGVTAYLRFVQKLREGERLIGSSATDVFDAVSGSSSDTDPTKEDDDDMPF